jgi:hypothetical protein
MSKSKLLFSITKDDFDIQFFRAGGKGGQNQNKVNSACRIIHRESGAVGECREHRDQLQNKKTAFERCVNSDKFKKWHRIKTAAVLTGYQKAEKMLNDMVDMAMKSHNLKIEAHTESGWKQIS